MPWVEFLTLAPSSDRILVELFQILKDDAVEKCCTQYAICWLPAVHIQCMRQGAQGWCTGMTLRDGMGREVGGGFRMGDMYTMADSCQSVAKTTTIL